LARSGCDFICNNDECEYYSTGFTMTGPWPLGDIDEVIESVENNSSESDLVSRLKENKGLGDELAMIPLPNEASVKYKKIRKSFWDDSKKRIYYLDCQPEEGNKARTHYLERSISSMLSFEEAIKVGINCPSCGNALNQKRWFSKEEI
jgi:hypothetical protein